MDIPSRATSLIGDVPEVVDFLKRNARRAKMTGYVCLGTTLFIGCLILATFLYFSQVTAQQRAERERSILQLVYDQQKQSVEAYQSSMERIARQGGDQKARDEAERNLGQIIKLFLERDPLKVGNPYDDVLYNLTSSIIRIGAVLVGIFLIQIMVTFGRYYFKLAEHLSMTAALISLSGGKISDLKAIAPLPLPTNIDFGKSPNSPAEKVLDGAFGAIKELSKKIPVR